MNNLITYENDIFFFPLPEARKIQENKSAIFLFEIEDVFIEDSKNQFKTDSHTLAIFPTTISTKNKNQNKNLILIPNEHNPLEAINAGRFFNYLGDATHCSELIFTPFNLFKNCPVTIENKYNVPKIEGFVKNIDLIRSQNNKWYWAIEFQKS